MADEAKKSTLVQLVKDFVDLEFISEESVYIFRKGSDTVQFTFQKTNSGGSMKG